MNNLSPEFCPAIVVMAKVPRAGEVKTRLRSFLNDEQIVSLATCFLQDTISNCSSITPNVIVAFTPRDERETLESILPENLLLIEQRGNSLGERLESAVEYAAKQNFNPVIIIGADSPTLPKEFIEAAIESFKSDETDVVLGATRDGGFYLIGLRKNHFGIFENVAWSSAFVFKQTAQNVESLGLRLTKLSRWYDVDTPDDLVFLRNEMLRDKNVPQVAPKTYQWLMSHAELFASKRV